MAEAKVESNEDLLPQILVRVPAKPLMKFKLVSKRWHSIISNPKFGRAHTQQNPSPPLSVLFFESTESTHILDQKFMRFSFHDHFLKKVPIFSFLQGVMINVHHSSNGLILGSRYLEDAREFVVANLTTQRYVILPGVADGFKEYAWKEKIMAEISGPESYLMIGNFLIYDPQKSDNYKVVIVRSSKGLEKSQFDVYSSESGSWKITIASYISYRARAAIWNGKFIWMELPLGLDCLIYQQFDIDAGILTTKRVHQRTICYEILYFGECGGHLFFIEENILERFKFRVLQMMDGGDFMWNFKCEVDLPDESRFSVVSVVEVGANVAVVVHSRGELRHYNMESKTWEVLCNSSADMSKYYHHMFESLTPPS